MRLLLLLVVLSFGLTLPAQSVKKKFKLPGILAEASGLYIASPDSLWWLNDSGNASALYLTDGRGRLLAAMPVPQSVNRDWEGLAADPEGHLYIGDFGNNGNRRQDLCIYRFHPLSRRLDSIRFRYPDQAAFPPPVEQWNFNMEGFFWKNDRLHLFSKNQLQKGNSYTKHYVLPAEPGTYVAELRDSLRLKRRVVTGAAISADGQTVALVAYNYQRLLGFIPITSQSIFTLRDFPEDRFLEGTLVKQKIPGCLTPKQYEAIDFLDGQNVIVGTERTVLVKQKAKRVKLKKK